MSKVDLILPKMGESVAEATILKWLKKPGDAIAVDENVLEIATDKVDSEVPSPVAGILTQRLFEEGAVVKVGAALAFIETDASAAAAVAPSVAPAPAASAAPVTAPAAVITTPTPTQAIERVSGSGRFYSPLVRSIAQQEGISAAELDTIPGTGLEGRVTKNDIMAYLPNKGKAAAAPVATLVAAAVPEVKASPAPEKTPAPAVSFSGEHEIVEMDRMRKLIADHMVMSKHTSPHVTSFVEADVTNMVQWRDKIKKDFEKREKEKITFTPIFVEAVAKAIKDFPMINVSVEGNKIIVKKQINIGLAVALPSGNLIVPVIKKADYMNLIGLTKSVNDLAARARINKLTPDDIQGGTFTLTNVGGFGNIMGTPIINQPQVAIMATGAIKKKPAVIETEQGDTIGIRHMMFLSLSYDHRVVDGSLGGSFLRRVADYLEQFDTSRTF